MAAPTLLVGLGGTGSKIVKQVRLLAKSHHMENNLSYVVFDTDVNELAAIREDTPEIEVVQTSTKQTVGEYLDKDTYARDNWFPVNKILNRKTLSEGAGQVRAISRLALNTAIKAGKMTPLHRAIERLYKLNGEATMQAMRVILVGSLCGGTGSGLILPVSMYIRNYLITRFQQNAAIMRGFFLLPEVFFEVIHGQEEQNNLKANAYAALRELDAFLMKGDGSLPDHYHLHFMAPRAGSEEMDEYDVSPMDFCFLYDAQNMDGNKQNSFQAYLSHAASCIYAQSIAPTSKRSNSSEDNVIRDLCKAGGRNRYCGAGSSMIIYPVDDVKEYLALTWLRDNISSDWLKIDRQFRKELEATQKARRKGLSVPSMDRMRHYITAVDTGADANSAFEATVRRQCMNLDKTGCIETGSRWESYLEALEAHVCDTAVSNRPDIDEMAEQCTSSAAIAKSGTSSSDEQAYNEWYANLQTYKAFAVRAAQDSAKTIAYTLFHDDADYTNGSDPFRLETWLRDQARGVMIHPNAVRYFLYNLALQLDSRILEQATEVEDIDNFFKKFDRELFDDKETEDVEHADDYIDMHLQDVHGVKRLVKRGALKDAKAFLEGNFGKYYDKITSYRTEYVMLEVLKEARSYVEGLCEGLHKFYAVLQRKLENVGTYLARLESKYNYIEGEPTRYVCASKKCLRGLSQEVVFMGDNMELPGGLTSMIFNRCKEFALMDSKPTSDEFFLGIYDDGGDGSVTDEDGTAVINSVMAFWRSAVMADYGSVVDMDVLEAMESEAKFEHAGEIYDQKTQKLYVSRIIEAAGVLSRPFIESPMGIEPRTIPACCYSTELTRNADPDRIDFINTYLGNNGGVADKDIDKHMIVFYQAIYGLRANDLSKFAPPKKAETYQRSGGEYYTAYFELTGKLLPDTTKSPAITPHIDKTWHVITALPDLDEGSQLEQEYNIQAAMFWGLLTGMVEFTRTPCKELYSLRFERQKDEMIVSNGTECDNLYEVLDSLTISPMNVSRIRAQVAKTIARERAEKRPVHQALLRKRLDSFELPEFPRPEGTDPTRTIFDIPMLMQRSKPVDEYQVDEIVRLMETIFKEIRNYLTGYFTGDDLSEYYGKLIYRQFKTFLAHIVEEKELSAQAIARQAELDRAAGLPLSEDVPLWFNIYNDDLFRSLLQLTREELEENYMSARADELERACKQLQD